MSLPGKFYATPLKSDIRKNLEANFIALLKLSLSEQNNFECLIVFRNGIT